MRDKSVCFSGHRNMPAESCNEIYKKLVGTVKTLAAEGYTEFYCGGAVGFDMMAETAVLDVKRNFPDISLHLILPYRGHNSGWSIIDKRKFEVIMKYARSVEYIFDRYVSWCFSERNKRMVDNSSVLVYYMTECKGGTWFTVKYAASKELKLFNLTQNV
ncbi:MAG: DUF1273 family protein [Clostridia bacterium]|nr:DUF1273 family protein [Clostridia bacterium]